MKFSDKPLTLEELEAYYVESEYIGQIALIQNNGTKVLAILDHRDDDGMCAIFAASGRYLKEKDYGKTWWAFPYVENEIDRNKWKPCEMCAPKCYRCESYQKYWEEVPEVCRGCKNYSHFVRDNIEDRFCSECGRPLTEEAWAELEKRIKEEWM